MQAYDDWNTHWNEFAIANSFNPAQKYRREMIIQMIHQLSPKECQIIDIGCGQGDMTALLTRCFPKNKIYGLDYSEQAIKLAQKKVNVAQFFKIDMRICNQVEFLKSSMDIAICSEVLEHLDDQLTFLKNIASLLKPHGTLIVTVPSGPRSAYDKHLGHRNHFKKSRLADLLSQTGFKTNKIFAAGFPFFNLYKLMVIMRGKHLVDDTRQKQMSLPASLVIHCFNILFKFNVKNFPGGWQLIAIASKSP